MLGLVGLFGMVPYGYAADPGAEFELVQVHHDDGTWSWKTDAAPSSGRLERGRILTWEYLGPARYPVGAERSLSVSYVIETEAPQTPVEQLLGTWRTDDQGGLWQVVDVNEEALREAVLWEDRVSYDAEPEALLEAMRVLPDPDEGAHVMVHYQAWTHEDCEPGGGNEVHLWNGESRVELFGALNRQEAAAVRVVVNDPALPGAACTGTILRDEWVLTAAHCVTDPATGTGLPGQNITIYRLDVQESRTVEHVYPAPNWTYSGTANDYALLKTSSSWSPDRKDMNLSAASNSTIGALNVARNLALPAWGEDAAGNACFPEGPYDLHVNVSDKIGGFLASSYLNFKMDGTSGHSGGPVYFCPQGNDDVCYDSDKANVVGVWSGWVSWPVSTHRGPKVPAFRTWALGIMNDD